MASEQPDAVEQEVDQARLRKLLEETATLIRTNPAAKTYTERSGDPYSGFNTVTRTYVDIPKNLSEDDLKLLAELKKQPRYDNYQPGERIELVVTVPEKRKEGVFNKLDRLSTINLRSKDGLKSLIRRPKNQYRVRLAHYSSEIRQTVDVRAPGVKREGGVLNAPIKPEVFRNTNSVDFTVEKGFLKKDKLTEIQARHLSEGTKNVYPAHPGWGEGQGFVADATGYSMKSTDQVEQFGRAILGRLPGGNQYSSAEFPKPSPQPTPKPTPSAPTPAAK